MKKIITSLVLTILCLFPIGVFAAGNITASPSSLTIEVGSSKTFTITASNTIGDVSISSSNAGVASVSTSEWGTGMVDEHQTKSGTITVTGKSVGPATITLTLDAATFDGEDLSGQRRTITVNVVPKPTNNNNNNNSSNNNNNNNNNNTNGGSNTNQTPNIVDNKSKNNNIKELSIDGYDIVKVDANNYTLTVSNDITSVNVKAVVEDAKAKVTGAGKHNLNVGENNIEVIVTSESGTQNKVNIKVTRKDGFYLEDLDDILKNDKIDEINITINSDSKLSSQDITKIKNSGKTINLNYFDENKKNIYTWILDGSKIRDFEEINTKFSFETKNKKEISKLSNYAEGLNINLEQSGLLPDGTKIKVFVGNKYSDGDMVNIYYYNKENNKLELIENKYSVKDGYVIFDVNKGNDYLVTMSTILDSNGEIVTQSKSTSILIPIIIILSLIVVTSSVFIIMKKRKDKSSVNKIEKVEI